MDVLEKIRALRLERSWTEYQLAESSGIPQSTISSWYRKNQMPTIPSLEKICAAFNMTLAQFFSAEASPFVQLTEIQSEMLNLWNRLTKEQQERFVALLQVM